MTRNRYRSYKSDTGLSIAIYLTIFAVLAVIVALVSAGCGALTSEAKARHALETQGFSNVHLVKRSVWFIQLQGCGNEDDARYEFRATNAAGKAVTVHVCEGVIKGATVRG